MIVMDLFPAGVLRLWDVIVNGYWHARQPAFTMSGLGGCLNRQDRLLLPARGHFLEHIGNADRDCGAASVSKRVWGKRPPGISLNPES